MVITRVCVCVYTCMPRVGRNSQCDLSRHPGHAIPGRRSTPLAWGLGNTLPRPRTKQESKQPLSLLPGCTAALRPEALNPITSPSDAPPKSTEGRAPGRGGQLGLSPISSWQLLLQTQQQQAGSGTHVAWVLKLVLPTEAHGHPTQSCDDPPSC